MAAEIVNFTDDLFGDGKAIIDLNLKEDEINLNHAICISEDRTLCGLAYGEYISTIRRGKVTCEDCINIITYCKQFKKGIDY